MVVNLSVVNGAAISINSGPAPKEQRRPPLYLEAMRDCRVCRYRNKLFSCVIGSDSSHLFKKTVERLTKIFVTG
jgi:hypothetical protein